MPVARLFDRCCGLSVLTWAACDVEILCDGEIDEKVKRSTTKRVSAAASSRSSGGGGRGARNAEKPCDGGFGEKKVKHAMTIEVTISTRVRAFGGLRLRDRGEKGARLGSYDGVGCGFIAGAELYDGGGERAAQGRGRCEC